MATSGSFKTGNYQGRCLYFTWSLVSQNVANNTSTISWKLQGYGTAESGYYKAGNFKVVINGDTVYSTSRSDRIELRDGTLVASGTKTITHNSDGTKTFSASAQGGIYTYDVNCTGSGSWDLTTIPRKSSLSVGNGTLGTSQTLTVTRQSTNFTHSIKAVCGSSTLYIKADGSTSTSEVKHSDCSIPFTPPISWASQNKTGTSVSVTYTIITYNGSTNVGSNSYTKTCTIPDSVKPSVSVSVSDPTGYKDKFGAYIQGQSKMKIAVTASGNQGSTIKSYKVTADGKTYSASSVTTDVISGTGTLKINVTVTDSRGRTNTASTSISVLAYFVPTITSLSAKRCNIVDGEPIASNAGTHILVEFDATVESLSNKNTATYTIEYKKMADNTYTPVELTEFDGVYTVSNGRCVFPADPSYSYNIVFTVTDDFGTIPKTIVGSSVKKLWSILKRPIERVGIAIGKIAEHENTFDIALLTLFTGGIKHPVLEPNTNLNDVRTPNTYVGEDISKNNYVNCPLTSGTFSLEVIGMGDDGQVKQRLTYCQKDVSRAWERIYHKSGTEMSWGNWICVSDFDGQLLWSNAYYMHAGQTVELSEPVSKQRSGIVLVFSLYADGVPKDNEFFEFFVPKHTIAKHNGAGRNFNLCGMFGNGVKYLYLSDNQITGNDKNSQQLTIGGITYDNTRYVLRYVIGV